MAVPETLTARADPSLDPVREVVAAYARAHGVDVRLWRRAGEDWTIALGTGGSSAAAPGPHAVAVDAPAAPESRLEVLRDAEPAVEEGHFLALVVGALLRNDAESRFFGREIAERYEEITLLYTISEVLGSVISLEEATRRILGEVIDTMAVKRAALWIHEPELDELRLVAAVGGEGRAEPIALTDDESITAAVFRERRPRILEPADVVPRSEPGAGEPRRESFLSVPVSYTPPNGESRTIGVINLIGRRVPEGFTAGDHKLITAIASQVGAAVENSRLVAEVLRQERVDRELELAHDLQLKLLPATGQFRDRADVAARCAQAESVGGDFYHLFGLSGGRFGVVIGDVSSHGFAAALIMALTMSAIAIHASEGDPPSQVLRRAHRALIDELESTEMYLSLFYAVIDPANGRLSYSNAGHPHAFMVSPSGTVRRLPVTNPPFGIIGLDNYAEETVDWSPRQDLLALFTDGLSDSLGKSDGERRIVDHISRNRDWPLDDLLRSLFELTPIGPANSHDDRTAVLVRA